MPKKERNQSGNPSKNFPSSSRSITSSCRDDCVVAAILAVLFPLCSNKTQMQPPQFPTLQQQNSAATDPHIAATAPKEKRKKAARQSKYQCGGDCAVTAQMLLAKNLFMCKVCNKGFQHEQNLQRHRRGHGLPWKLLKNPKENRGKGVPMPRADVHSPRSMTSAGGPYGDEEAYCRKHGEKKWNFNKYNKRYAVLSDWKVHSKMCGMSEYRCDGTLFLRQLVQSQL
ncbi:hypothetical protein EJB05_43935, partial [Eragrostis curvula]